MSEIDLEQEFAVWVPPRDPQAVTQLLKELSETGDQGIQVYGDRGEGNIIFTIESGLQFITSGGVIVHITEDQAAHMVYSQSDEN